MSDRLDSAKAALEAERKELQNALSRVEKALSELGGSVRGRVSPRRSPGSNARRKTRRGGRRTTNRAEQLKGVLKGTDGLRPSEIAREMGVSQSQVHGIVKRLGEKGEVTKTDGKVKLR